MEFDKFVSNIVEQQFPAFYHAEGENFVTFVRAYYEWMEQTGYTINASKSLLDYKDIDTTIDAFLDNFKNEFLVNFPSITSANKQFMVKRIKDFYQAKGSVQGMELLFRLLFDDDIVVYDPGNDIIKASDGIWRVPAYIEVEHNPRSVLFVNQQITGSKSGATAFVESVHTTVINQRIIDVLNISRVSGNFLYNELITENGNLQDAPRVVGSLTAINITDGGANNKIGDVFQVYSSTNGKYGSVKVTATTDGTGRVTFRLLDGGSGYTNSASQVHISNTVLFTSNRSNSNGTPDYNTFDYLRQPLSSLNWTVSSPSNPNTALLYHTQVAGYNGNTVVANGYIVDTSTANTIIINVTNGDFSTATSVMTPSNTISFTGYTLANVTATGVITGSNSTAVGVHNVINTFYANGAFVVSSEPSFTITANATTKSTGSGANFQIGSLTDTEVVSMFTDLISGNNVNNIPYLNMLVCGSNSNTGLLLGTGSITANSATNIINGTTSAFTTDLVVGFGLYTSGNVFIGTVNAIANSTRLSLTSNALANVVTSTYRYNINQYGFPKNYAAGYNSILLDALTFQTFTIGTIASLSAINPGTNYNTNPFVAVRDNYVAPFNRKNIILQLANKTGAFSVGDTISQSYTTPVETLAYNARVGAFTVGEGVYQSNGSANSYATLQSANSTALVLTDIRGTFLANSVGGQALTGLKSAATANVTTVTGTTTTNLAKGRIVSLPDPTSIEIKRTSFNQAFQYGSQVTSSSGGSANVMGASQNTASAPMGYNAIVSANVSIAQGIATQVQVIDSGFGHQPGDVIELVNNTNPFAIAGTANVYHQGLGQGYWENNQGKLNSDKYIIDDYYYQGYSYEIQSRLSMDKYADILKKLAHVVGTKMFGKVLIGSENTMQLTPIPATITFTT
jgi:hypothetical protein